MAHQLTAGPSGPSPRLGNGWLGAPTVTPKTFVSMNCNANSIKGVLDTLEQQLKVLESEIKADEKGKMEFERDIGRMEKRRNEIHARMDSGLSWAGNYDSDIGPFEAKYKEMTGDIGNLYESAKSRHRAGIELLKQEFNYHPEFKRPQDTFTGIPFKPK